jgi:hypothetical protein
VRTQDSLDFWVLGGLRTIRKQSESEIRFALPIQSRTEGLQSDLPIDVNPSHAFRKDCDPSAHLWSFSLKFFFRTSLVS